MIVNVSLGAHNAYPTPIGMAQLLIPRDGSPSVLTVDGKALKAWKRFHPIPIAFSGDLVTIQLRGQKQKWTGHLSGARQPTPDSLGFELADLLPVAAFPSA